MTANRGVDFEPQMSDQTKPIFDESDFATEAPTDSACGRPAKRGAPGTYITPPLLRKTDAAPVVAKPSAASRTMSSRRVVTAVKVVDKPPADSAPPPASAPAFADGMDVSGLWMPEPAERSYRDRRKVSRKNPTPTNDHDGYASSEESSHKASGGSTSPLLDLHTIEQPMDLGAVPSSHPMDLTGLKDTLDQTLTSTLSSSLDSPEVTALLEHSDMASYLDGSAEMALFANVSSFGSAPPGASRIPPPAQHPTHPLRRARRGSNTSLADTSASEAAPSTNEPPAQLDDLTDEQLEALPSDASRRKVRHNLTERRRVDRMNQLFNRLAMTLAGEKAAPAITLTDLDAAQRAELTEMGAKPKWSKADVLESAINVVNDLRRQLEEERLARTLGVPMHADFPDPDSVSMPLSAVPSLT